MSDSLSVISTAGDSSFACVLYFALAVAVLAVPGGLHLVDGRLYDVRTHDITPLMAPL